MVSTTTVAFESVVETLATFADPAELTGRNSYHKGVVLDILGNDGARTDEGRAAYGVTTDNGTVGTEGGTFLDECLGIDAVNREMGTGCRDIGENAGGAAEHIVLNLHTFIDGNIVLNTDAIADADIVANVDILTQGAVLAQTSTLLDMAEVPDLRAFADFYVFVNITTRMYEIFFHIIYHELHELHELYSTVN